jgi:hypothetical protein
MPVRSLWPIHLVSSIHDIGPHANRILANAAFDWLVPKMAAMYPESSKNRWSDFLTINPTTDCFHLQSVCQFCKVCSIHIAVPVRIAFAGQ